ncbi:carboxypeptidase regulatory-like domain-containing protein [Cellulomonas humilata]|uniref:Carboxypeptidase regulatory-like domain-containing protein n=1 Tax=Cellulomonas humilata TaxID=144055 RepID=A0A7Y6A1L7_9CELL|nr:carboxypeptidase regulatory-like domain-containing protein [Cellulomonas humilata]NUU18046.1 carboxypeptidase regulatory-like domain-containing protein [Cellulomonas humilata]
MSTDERTLALVAAGGLDLDDRRILNHLAELVERADPVPPGLIESIGMALTIEAMHAEVAELHLVGEPALAVRADETSIEAGTITFTTDVLTVMISVHAEAGRVRVDGWAAPAGELSVELHQGGDMTSTTSDSDGRFSFSDIERGPARLVLRRPSEPTIPIVTPQIEL